ncbi:MAG: Gfo/Idh/MocA family oxidoreductase [Opitutaceae bacterium]|nr:Gfo/Idh/MocA family oxidoreductase [Opitutaceae bacterium]
MSDPLVHCGVAGVGSLGQHHARIYSTLPGARYVGFFETNDARAAEIQGRFGGERFATLEALGKACDAVSVVVPTDRHAAVAIPLLSQGCHLLIEKPLTATLPEAEAVLEAAKAAGLLVQVGHIEHFNPVMAFLEKEVSDARFITTERLAPFTPRGTEVGVVLDLMIHDIGIVLELVKSPVQKIDSVGLSVLSATEDIANARIQFANGCVANLSASRMSLKKVREIRVFQSSAYLSFDFMNQSGHLVKRAGMLEYAARIQAGEIKPGDLAAVPLEPVPIEKGEPLARELAHFVDSVARASRPKVDAVLGKTALELAIAITAQIRAGTRR